MIPTDYQAFIHQSRYSRWLDEEGRRETWEETVTRLLDFYNDFLTKKYEFTFGPDLYANLYNAIVNMQVMPSMRAMMTAGPALARNHIAAYNCSYLPVDSPRAFDECLYILKENDMEIPISLVNDIVNYLSRQPWREVDTLIKGIIQAQAQEKSAVETEQKELPIDDN